MITLWIAIVLLVVGVASFLAILLFLISKIIANPIFLLIINRSEQCELERIISPVRVIQLLGNIILVIAVIIIFSIGNL